MVEDEKELHFTVMYRGKPLQLKAPAGSKLSDLGKEIVDLTGVAPHTLLLILPKRPPLQPMLEQHGTKLLYQSGTQGMKMTMMGSSSAEVAAVSQPLIKDRIIGFSEEEQRARQRSGSSSEFHSLPKGIEIFCDFQPLQLPGIENRGQEISLRLRTDDLKGFRKYESLKKTLLHELVSPVQTGRNLLYAIQAHMVHDEHEEMFHALDKNLNEEAIALDWTKSYGHTLSGVKFEDSFNVVESKGSGQSFHCWTSMNVFGTIKEGEKKVRGSNFQTFSDSKHELGLSWKNDVHLKNRFIETAYSITPCLGNKQEPKSSTTVICHRSVLTPTA